MKIVRRILAPALFAVLAVVSLNTFAPAADDGDQLAKCRWVKGIGVVCDTELGTITL